jgi:hypothetical protein
MFLIRLTCVKISRHFVDIAHSHEFSDDLTRFFDVIEVIFLILFRERNAFDDDFDVNEIEERISWCCFVKYSLFKWVFERLTTSFINASNIIAISLKIDDESDRNDCVTSCDSKLINDDDNDDDDEVRSKKKSTKIILWFFFFSIEDIIIEKKKTTKIVLRFFFFFFKVNFIEKKKTTKIVFRFFFFFKRTTNDDDMMTMIFVSISKRDDMKIFVVTLTQSSLIEVIFFRTFLFEFFNQYSIALIIVFIASWIDQLLMTTFLMFRRTSIDWLIAYSYFFLSQNRSMMWIVFW